METKYNHNSQLSPEDEARSNAFDVFESYAHVEAVAYGQTGTLGTLLEQCPLNLEEMNPQKLKEITFVALNKAGAEIHPEHAKMAATILAGKNIENNLTIFDPNSKAAQKYNEHQAQRLLQKTTPDSVMVGNETKQTMNEKKAPSAVEEKTLVESVVVAAKPLVELVVQEKQVLEAESRVQSQMIEPKNNLEQISEKLTVLENGLTDSYVSQDETLVESALAYEPESIEVIEDADSGTPSFVSKQVELPSEDVEVIAVGEPQSPIKQVIEIWQPAEVPAEQSVILNAETGEEKQILVLPESHVTAALLSLETIMTDNEGASISLSEVTFEQINDQLELLEDGELKQVGQELSTEMSELTEDIRLTQELLVREVELQFSEIELPEQLDFMFYPERPASLREVVEQFAQLDPDQLPESVVVVYQELLQKIAVLQEKTAAFMNLFDIMYDIETHAVVLLLKFSDPMRERIDSDESNLADIFSDASRTVQGYLAQLALGRSTGGAAIMSV